MSNFRFKEGDIVVLDKEDNCIGIEKGNLLLITQLDHEEGSYKGYSFTGKTQAEYDYVDNYKDYRWFFWDKELRPLIFPDLLKPFIIDKFDDPKFISYLRNSLFYSLT